MSTEGMNELHELYKVQCQVEFKAQQCKAHGYKHLEGAYNKIARQIQLEIIQLHHTLFEGGDEQ